MTVGNRNMQFLPPHGVGMPGAPVQGGGGSGSQAAFTPAGRMPIPFRDPVDAARSMMTGRTPSAEYPDGYLGTINSRRSDRLLDSLKDNLNQRAYQRGVHKGERIDPSDYFWPKEFTPEDGIMRGMAAEPDFVDGVQVLRVQRFAARGTVRDRLTVLGQRMPRGAESLMMTPGDIARANQLRPAWS